MAALFIAFALISALWIPRYRPDFPGKKGVSLFVVLTLVLMVGMLGAVVVLAKEDHEAEAAEQGQVSTGGEGQESEQGETNPTGQTTPTTTGGGEEAPAGDAAAGKALFASNGCGGCHALAAASASGTVGTNLDAALGDKDADYVHESIVEPNADIAEGYQPGIMPSFDQLSDKQVDDLVAFLKSG